jgi:tRNA-splicing ligase RtcB
MKLKKINEYSYKIEKEQKMNTDVKIFASEKLMEKMLQDKCLEQGMNTACLPGIFGLSIMMPDAHQGYGFSIGGVAATDTKNGCISPGGVGFDINCGVRLLSTDLERDEVETKIEELLERLFKHIPPGVGGKSIFRLETKELDEVLKNGPSWFLKKGIGLQEDVDACENNGVMKDSNPDKISDKAKKRGKAQLGTLGSGNHFLEIQYVDKIFDENKAKVFGIKKEGQVVILIHTGSRGLGHQVCSDYLRSIEEEYKDIIEKLPDKNLAYAPAQSQLAKDYYQAMCAAANFAWTNRHVIGHQTRKAFEEVFDKSVEINTVYDVAHNIAKIEKHKFEGEEKDVWVHRKGATRAFGPGNEELPEKYKKTGQPIFIPGSMGTSSYVLAGTQKAMDESFGSTAHGAGRLLSRYKSNENFTGKGIKEELLKKRIYIKAASMRGISEEAPKAYKDVDEVVKVSHKAGIGLLVSKLKPIGVIKG